MGELKNRGREGVQENQDRYRETQEVGEQNLEERARNMSIIQTFEGVDDDDKTAIEDGKNSGREIAEQLAESTMETPKNEINSSMESTISEMRGFAGREADDANKASAMDGNYVGVGSSLESKFEESAREFEDIAMSGEEIKESSNEQIDSMIQTMKMEW